MRLAAVLVVVLAHVVDAAPAEHTEEELVGVITMQPRAPHAAAYVDLLLDRLNAGNRFEELSVWVDRLLEMPQILRGRPELTRRLQTLQIQLRTARAHRAYRRGQESGGIEAWREAARLYLSIADLQHKLGEPTDEALFNAGVSLVGAAEPYAALVAWDRVQADPALVPHARERMFGIVVRAPVIWLAAAAALVTD